MNTSTIIIIGCIIAAVTLALVSARKNEYNTLSQTQPVFTNVYTNNRTGVKCGITADAINNIWCVDTKSRVLDWSQLLIPAHVDKLIGISNYNAIEAVVGKNIYVGTYDTMTRVNPQDPVWTIIKNRNKVYNAM